MQVIRISEVVIISMLILFVANELNILVATSGDTGSAVAHGFYDVEGINVIILYPSGKVSGIQEKQLTTLYKNIYSCVLFYFKLHNIVVR